MKDTDCTVKLASPDAFLFTVHDPAMGKWCSDLDVRGGEVHSFVLNNYWHINYLDEQGGLFTFRYAITFARRIAPEDAFRYGWGHRQRVVAQRMSYQEFRGEMPEVLLGPESWILFSAPSNHITVNAIRRNRKAPESHVVRLREIGGREGNIELSMPGHRIVAMQNIDHQEHELGAKRAPVHMTP